MAAEPDVSAGAVEIVRAVRAGELDPVAAVRARLDRIEALDRELGAFEVVRRDAALAEAAAVAARGDLASLALAGLPVAVKDVVPVTGEPQRAGSAAGSDAPAGHDHPLVARLRDAGAVVVGTTRTPEACLWPTTDTPAGVTRNPWNLGFSPGGSSGGSGAAVAAGFVPVAHGTDGLGSVRIPAAACGLVGIKPGRGVVTPVDLAAEAWFGLSEHGVLATSAADAALVLSVLAQDPALARPPDPGRVRVAVSTTPPVAGVRVRREVVRVTFEVAAALAGTGDRVERVRLRYPTSTGLHGVLRWYAAAARDLDAMAAPQRAQPRTVAHAALGRRVAGRVREEQATAWAARALTWFDDVDVLLTPVLATGPLPAHHWSQRPWTANVATALTSTGGFPAAWNLAGFPAVSVPGGLDRETGLPVGVQLVGPPGSEALLLALAARVEQARPWPTRAPGYR